MRSTRRRRIYTKAWCGLPGALGMLALPALAAASLGAGVGAAPIGLGQSARAGRAYTLPGLYVVNTGTLRSLYHVRVQRLSPGSATTLPAGWVSIERNDFPLAAHQSTIVPLKITIPAKATAGNYLSDVVASTTSSPHARGTSLGAAAATKLQVSIAGDGSTFPWKTIVWIGGALLVVAGATWTIRRSGLWVRLVHG